MVLGDEPHANECHACVLMYGASVVFVVIAENNHEST